MAKFKVGAKAVIMCSNWQRNINRIVVLEERVDNNGRFRSKRPAMNFPAWFVSDGGTFDGYNNGHYCPSKRLLIPQWKLRLLDDDEPTSKVGNIKYVMEPA